MRIKISKQGNDFIVDPIDQTGSPAIGRGRTLLEAMGSFLISQQKNLGLVIEVDASAQPAELARRRRAMKNR